MYIEGFIPVHTLCGSLPLGGILVALSGGADSSLLLYELCEFGKRNGVLIYAAHLNHMIRGADADRDEEFCVRSCRRLGVRLFSKRVDVPKIAEGTGLGLEATARKERYDFFREIMNKEGIKVLATAHNSDDNLETVLFNLTRGSGLSGMGGIRAVRPFEGVDGGIVIRPLIDCPKSLILKTCAERGIEYVTDATNLDTAYSRNRIRQNVIPELEKISSGVREAAQRLARAAREDDDCLYRLADKFIAEREGKIYAREVAALDAAIAKRVLIRLCAAVSDVLPEAVHLEAALKLCRKANAGSSLSFPDKIRFFLSCDGCAVGFCSEDEWERMQNEGEFDGDETKVLKIPDAGEVCYTTFGGQSIIAFRPDKDFEQIRQITAKANTSLNVYNKSTYLLIKFGRISDVILVRHYRPSDRILRGGIRKSVRDILRESGVPKNLRRSFPVFCLKSAPDEVLALPSVTGAVKEGYGVMPSDIDADTLIITIGTES